ncbi:MAG: hypothetical protein ABR878_03570 [Roseiarcus sp.]
MRTRMFIIALASASLLSFGAYAKTGNHSSISQHGAFNVAGAGQFAAFGGTNNSSISQHGAFNFAATGQVAVFGGHNSSSVSQHGVGNVAVTSQTAF